MLRLITRGFKAADLDLMLARTSLMLAPNGHGKSGVLDAITWALIGHVPRLGKTAAATSALLRGREMTVRLEFDGHWIERTLRRAPKGGFQTECRTSFCTGTRNEEHEAAVLALVTSNGSIDEAAESLDIGQLIRLTPAQRASRIQELIERGGDIGALAVAVARRWMQTLASVDDARMPDDHTALRPLIAGYDQSGAEAHTGEYACLRTMAGQMQAKLREVGIAGALAWANEQKRLQAAQLTNKKQAKREIEARLQETPDPNPDEIARLEEARATLDQQIGAATEREGARQRQADVLTEARAAHGAAERGLSAARAARQAFDGQAAELPAWRAQHAEILAEIDALVAPTPPDYGEADALDRQAGEADRGAAAVDVPALPDLTALQAAVTAAATALRQAEASPWARVQAIAVELAAEGTTLAKSKNLVAKAFGEKVAERMAEQATLAAANGPGDVAARTQALRNAEAALATGAREAEAIEAARTVKLAERSGHEEIAREARSRAEDIRTGLGDTYRQERALYTERQADLIAERDRLKALIDGVAGKDAGTTEALADAEQKLTAAAQRLADLQATTTGEADPVDLPTAAALTAERAQVQQQLGVLTAAQTKRAEFRSLVAEIGALEVSETVCKALEKALQRVRADEIAHGAEPLLSIMREVLTAAGRAEIPYLLGWTNAAGEQVPVEALSGSEYAIWATALCAAVIIRRGAPRRFVLVEAAEADGEALAQLMAGVSAIADRVTAAVIATPHSPARVPAGWVTLAPRGESAAAVAA